MTKPLMLFWKLSFYLRETGEPWTVIVQAPASYSSEKICDTLQGVHPEYMDLSAEQIERPPHIKAWGEEEEAKPPPPDPSEPSELLEALQEEA